jgi:hypothetical protein
MVLCLNPGSRAIWKSVRKVCGERSGIHGSLITSVPSMMLRLGQLRRILTGMRIIDTDRRSNRRTAARLSHRTTVSNVFENGIESLLGLRRRCVRLGTHLKGIEGDKMKQDNTHTTLKPHLTNPHLINNHHPTTRATPAPTLMHPNSLDKRSLRITQQLIRQILLGRERGVALRRVGTQPIHIEARAGDGRVAVAEETSLRRAARRTSIRIREQHHPGPRFLQQILQPHFRAIMRLNLPAETGEVVDLAPYAELRDAIGCERRGLSWFRRESGLSFIREGLDLAPVLRSRQ